MAAYRGTLGEALRLAAESGGEAGANAEAAAQNLYGADDGSGPTVGGQGSYEPLPPKPPAEPYPGGGGEEEEPADVAGDAAAHLRRLGHGASLTTVEVGGGGGPQLAAPAPGGGGGGGAGAYEPAVIPKDVQALGEQLYGPTDQAPEVARMEVEDGYDADSGSPSMRERLPERADVVVAWFWDQKRPTRYKRVGLAALGCACCIVISVLLFLFLALLGLRNAKLDPTYLHVHSLCGTSNDVDLNTVIRNPCIIHAATDATKMTFSYDGDDFGEATLPPLDLQPSSDIFINVTETITITDEPVATKVINHYLSGELLQIDYKLPITLHALSSTFVVNLDNFFLFNNLTEEEKLERENEPSKWSLVRINANNNTRDALEVGVDMTYNHTNERLTADVGGLVLEFFNTTDNARIARGVVDPIELRPGLTPLSAVAHLHKEDITPVRDAFNSFLADELVDTYLRASGTENQGCLVQRLLVDLDFITVLNEPEPEAPAAPSGGGGTATAAPAPAASSDAERRLQQQEQDADTLAKAREAAQVHAAWRDEQRGDGASTELNRVLARHRQQDLKYQAQSDFLYDHEITEASNVKISELWRRRQTSSTNGGFEIRDLRLADVGQNHMDVEVEFEFDSLEVYGDFPDLEMHLTNTATDELLITLTMGLQLEPVNVITVNATTDGSISMEVALGRALELLIDANGENLGLHMALHGVPMTPQRLAAVTMATAVVAGMNFPFSVGGPSAALPPGTPPPEPALQLRHLELEGARSADPNWVSFRLDLKADFAKLSGQIPGLNLALSSQRGPLIWVRTEPFALTPKGPRDRTFSNSGINHLGLGRTELFNVTHSLTFDIQVIDSALLTASVNDLFEGLDTELRIQGDDSPARTPPPGTPTAFVNGTLLQRVAARWQQTFDFNTQQSANGAQQTGNGGVMPAVNMSVETSSGGNLLGWVWLWVELPLDSMSVYAGDVRATLSYLNQGVVNMVLPNAMLHGDRPNLINVSVEIDATTGPKMSAIEDFLSAYLFGTNALSADASGTLSVPFDRPEYVAIQLDYGFTLPKDPGGNGTNPIQCIETTYMSEPNELLIPFGECELTLHLAAFVQNPIPWFALGAESIDFDVYFEDPDESVIRILGIAVAGPYSRNMNVFMAHVSEPIDAAATGTQVPISGPLPIEIPPLATGDTVIRMTTPNGAQGTEICVRLDQEYNAKGTLTLNIVNGRARLRVGQLVLGLSFDMPGIVMEDDSSDPRTCREKLGYSNDVMRRARTARLAPSSNSQLERRAPTP